MKITTAQLKQIIREEIKSYNSKGIEEADIKKSDLTLGQEIIGGKKYYFLYNQKTGKKSELFDSKKEAEKALNSSSTKDISMFNRTKTATNKGAGSGSQSFGYNNNGKETKLSKVKVGMPIRVKVYYDKGAGSGSQGSYEVEGFVKNFAGGKLRIIPPHEKGQRSISVDISDITKVYDLSKN